MIGMTELLRRQYFWYTGKINDTAINTVDCGKRVFLDQHGVQFHRADIDVWEAQGTLKIYCPGFLIGFKPGDDYDRLNRMFVDLASVLKDDIRLADALTHASSVDRAWFLGKLEDLRRTCFSRPETLSAIGLNETHLSYDRSIALQDIFAADYLQAGTKSRDRLVLAIGHLKTVYVAMASHYSVEAHMDDSFIPCPWHLPTLVWEEIARHGEASPRLAGLDLAQYQTGMRFERRQRLSPDLFRFEPILASLIRPLVCGDGKIMEFRNWASFQRRVVESISNPRILAVFQAFADAMDISLPQAVFAAWRMLRKDVRKRGWKFIISPDTALSRFDDIRRFHEQSLSCYYRNYELVRDTTGKRQYRQFQQLMELAGRIEYLNSYIGCYKFIPWKITDANFHGGYLPYALMRQEKHVLYKELCGEARHVWRPKGYWFRDVLPELLADNPSMYAKWFLPLLEDGYIDEGIIADAHRVCLNCIKSLGPA